MKKVSILFALIICVILPSQVYAVGENSTGRQVENKNQVQTQNQGEDQQLLIETQENEGQEVEDIDSDDFKNSSDVAKQVQLLLETKTTGGIGDEVREIARSQTQAQEEIENQLQKISSKKSFVKSLFGPDYKAIKDLEKNMEENRLRIQLLTELKTELKNQSDLTNLEKTIQALIEQNTKLQEVVNRENQIKSLFGWFIKFFAK